MSDAVWLALIAAIVVPLVNLVTNTVLIWLQGRASKASLDKMGGDLARIEHHTNSMTEQLVRVTRSDALQEGAQDERDKQNANE